MLVRRVVLAQEQHCPDYLARAEGRVGERRSFQLVVVQQKHCCCVAFSEHPVQMDGYCDACCHPVGSAAVYFAVPCGRYRGVSHGDAVCCRRQRARALGEAACPMGVAVLEQEGAEEYPDRVAPVFYWIDLAELLPAGYRAQEDRGHPLVDSCTPADGCQSAHRRTSHREGIPAAGDCLSGREA